MYRVSAQGVDERMINVHYYYYCSVVFVTEHQLYNAMVAGFNTFVRKKI